MDRNPKAYQVLAVGSCPKEIKTKLCINRYSRWLYPLPILVRTVFRYSHGFYLFPVLARILPFLGTHTDCTLFRYSSRQFFGTRTDSTFSRYSPLFYHFWVLTQIVTSSDTPSVQFFGTRTGSTFSRYWPGLYHFSALTLIVASSDTRPDSFSVLGRILPFPGTRPDSTIFRYSRWLYPLLILVRTIFR